MWWSQMPSKSDGLCCGSAALTHHPLSGNTALFSLWSPAHKKIKMCNLKYNVYCTFLFKFDEQQSVISHLILQVPNSVLVGELLITSTTLWQNATLKATHVEEQIRVVFAVDRYKAVLPLDGSH